MPINEFEANLLRGGKQIQRTKNCVCFEEEDKLGELGEYRQSGWLSEPYQGKHPGISLSIRYQSLGECPEREDVRVSAQSVFASQVMRSAFNDYGSLQ